jgi:branched-subunit amino acid aminotransferase/4-amino-4-deoxychorismate lyase
MVEGGRPLPELKSCSSFVSVLAQQFADKSGYNTALLMQGSEVLEAAWGNIIWISKKAGKLMYRTEGVLSGVAQTLITQNFPHEVIDCKFSLNDLYENASAVFFCNAVRGVIPVAQINEWNVPQCDRYFVEINKVWQESEVIRIS